MPSFKSEEARFIERDFSCEEVKAVVFMMMGDKVPSPNGFPILFFQKYWDILEEDVMHMVNDFHANGSDMGRI